MSKVTVSDQTLTVYRVDCDECGEVNSKPLMTYTHAHDLRHAHEERHKENQE